MVLDADQQVAAFTVADNGDCNAARINREQGFEILGIRERIAAHGGSIGMQRAVCAWRQP